MEIKLVRCKGCRKNIIPQSNGIYHFCGTECKIAWLNSPEGKRKMTITSKVLEKQHKVEVKARAIRMKESVKSLSDYTKELQKEINTIVRLIDKGHVCISSQKTCNKFDAGHFISCSAAGFLRFNLFNIYAQGVHSNQYKSGDIHNYRIGLYTIFGLSHLEFVEGLRLKYQHIKFDKETLKEKIVIAREIVRELKKADLTYSTLERLELRELYNNQLGIYL